MLTHTSALVASATPEDHVHCTYLVGFAGGMLKVGYTATPRPRIIKLCEAVKRKRNADAMKVRVFIRDGAGAAGAGIADSLSARRLESAAIQTLHTLGGRCIQGREFFTGVDFDDAAAAIDALASRTTVEA